VDGTYEITLHFMVKGELKAEGLPPITWPVASLWLRGYVIRAGEEVWKEEIWQRGVFGHWLIDESVSGTFTVPLQTDNYHIYGLAWSRSMVWADWWPGEALSEFRGSGGVWLEQIEIRLVSSPSETGSLTVSVYDSRGAPVSVPDLNTMVIFQDTPGNIYEIISTPTLTTNSYTWNALPSGHSYLVEAYVNDMYSGSSGWIAIESPGVSKSVSIITYDSSFLKVKTTFSDGITPLPGAYVEIYSHKGTLWRSGDTDSNGETTWFSLQPTTVSGESYQIYVFYDGEQVGATEGVTLSSSEWTVHHITTTVDPPNEAPVLSNGYVTPTSGTTSTLFYYYVHYYDTDGDAPTQREVCIDGSDWHIMTHHNGSTYDGFYRCVLTLSEGSHNYYFKFSDGVNPPVLLPPSGTYSGPTVSAPNAPPVLSNGYVTPTSGTTSTLFSYYVDYYDPDGDSPTQRDCVVDGAFHQMMLVGGSASDGTYRYQSTLSEGSHNYYFKFSDGVNPPVLLPPSGTYSGPTVTSGGAVPEFPLGLALEMLFIPVVIYLLWRSRQRKKMLP